MRGQPDLTRWNRAGLKRFRYVDGNAATYLEHLRQALRESFPQWSDLVDARYESETGNIAWEIARSFARALHVLMEHVDAYANETYLGTATQWDEVRRMVEMLDYHPAPPASASTYLALTVKDGKRGTVEAGFQVKHSPPGGGPAVVFETLSDVEVDAAFNLLKPQGHDRSQVPLEGNTLTLEGELARVQLGDPLIIEALSEEGTKAGSQSQAVVVSGLHIADGHTELTVLPGLQQVFKRGYTLVHLEPADRLAYLNPYTRDVRNIDTLVLEEATSLPQLKELLWIDDGENQYYRRLVKVEGRRLVLSSPLSDLGLDRAWVSRPVDVPVTRWDAADAETGNYPIQAPGDWTRLRGTVVVGPAAHELLHFKVVSAEYVPHEPLSDLSGLTLMQLQCQSGSCKPDKTQGLWVPPATTGLWKVDTSIERTEGAPLPATFDVSKPKKASAGDWLVLLDEESPAWTRAASVTVDADTGTGQIGIATEWNEYENSSGKDYFLSQTRVYTHFSRSARPLGWQENHESLAGEQSVPLAGGIRGLSADRPVMIENDDPHGAMVTTIVSVGPDRIDLADSLPRGSEYGNLKIAGNLVLAGHGERKEGLVLGSGDASRINQFFVLEVAGIAFVADPAQSTGVRADIEVTVDGRRWTQVSTLNDSKPSDDHYRVRLTEDGYLNIGFGDGRHGRRLPTGVNNVRVRYRRGTGLAGILPAGSLTKLAKPHPLIKGVRQPMETAGGNDREAVTSMRENAPATVLTLERAVSLSDFAALATSHSSVWQAKAFFDKSGFAAKEIIEVVVVPAGGSETLGSLGQVIGDYLQSHAVPGVLVKVSTYERVGFEVQAHLTVDQAHYDPESVMAKVEAALYDAFTVQARKLGQSVYLSEVYKIVERVAGVEHSRITLTGDYQPRSKQIAILEGLQLIDLSSGVIGKGEKKPLDG